MSVLTRGTMWGLCSVFLINFVHKERERERDGILGLLVSTQNALLLWVEVEVRPALSIIHPLTLDCGEVSAQQHRERCGGVRVRRIAALQPQQPLQLHSTTTHSTH